MDSTYGPESEFPKSSLRELPEFGRFKITVTAAKYNDGLLLDPGAEPQNTPESITRRDLKTPGSVNIPKAGLYQVDVYPQDLAAPAPDISRLGSGLAASFPLDGEPVGRLRGEAKFVDSPFGKSASLNSGDDTVVIPHSDALAVGTGDFTISVWIHPATLHKSSVIARGGDAVHGWFLELSDNKGTLRFETYGPDNKSNGALATAAGAIRSGAWQHLTVAVKREKRTDHLNQSRIYVDGYVAARGAVAEANLDDPMLDLRLGGPGSAHPPIPDAMAPNPGPNQQFQGELDEVRIYRRTLSEPEIQGLVEPGKQFVTEAPAPGGRGGTGGRRPPKPDLVTLNLGDRYFSGTVQPAFVAVRLAAGPLMVGAQNTGRRDLDRIVLTPLAENTTVAKSFLAFEKRLPRLGVHLGLRRDCGSTFAPVGLPQTVTGEKLAPYVFEGTLRNFPSPQSEKENVNYLQGVHEIGIRSEYTDGRDMPRLVIRSMEFEGPYYEQWPPASYKNIFVDFDRKSDLPAYAQKIIHNFATRAYRRPVTAAGRSLSDGGIPAVIRVRQQLYGKREGCLACRADISTVFVPHRGQ